MKIFRCDHCRQPVFFDNSSCVSCHHLLAYMPDLGVVSSLDPAGNNLWRSPLSLSGGQLYRLCQNYERENICNWAVPTDDAHQLCRSCRLTRVIPDLSQEGHREAWYRLEAAKRRLVYSLLALYLPVENKEDDPQHGLAFELLADAPALGAAPVLTGHSHGVITINVAEADDVEREKRRLQLHEPYRTLLGHFRHEVGHYYWDRLIENSDLIDPFRLLFGDERESYDEALKRHYERGAPADWQRRFVSAYASMHPWEDWAETWAHYLHMTDVLETAHSSGVTIRSGIRAEVSVEPGMGVGARGSFDTMLNDWFALTQVLNNLNRSMGLPDAYPFVLSTPAIEKLRFVHETVEGQAEISMLICR